MLTNKFFRSLTFLLVILMFAGCQELINSDNASAPSEALISQTDPELAVLNDEVANVSSVTDDPLTADGIFTISWNEFLLPGDSVLTLRSHVFAVAPDSDTLSRWGLDMGDVALAYDAESVELNKIETVCGGIFYSLGTKPLGPGRRGGGRHGNAGQIVFNDSTTVPFLPSSDYTFTATGTDSFPALSLTATAPAGLITITAPAAFDSVSGSADLELAWTGGEAAQPIMVTVKPVIRPIGHGGRHHGGHHGGPGVPPDPAGSFGGPNMPHHLFSEFALRYVLDENTGAFTVPAADLVQLLTDYPATKLVLQVQQLVTSEITDDLGTFIMQFRLGDGVPVAVN
jgi:hypothetical protein